MFRDYWPTAKLNESSPTVQHYRKACRVATDCPVTSRHVFVGCGRVEKGLTRALTHILSCAPDLTPMLAPVTVQPPAHLLKPSVVQCRQPEDRLTINQT